jgi:hypothetical protein
MSLCQVRKPIYQLKCDSRTRGRYGYEPTGAKGASEFGESTPIFAVSCATARIARAA